MPRDILPALRVIDLSHSVAGAYCTKLLADFGAEVVLVEAPEGHPLRRAGPFPNDQPHPETSGTFLHLCTNKKSVTLNRGTPDGRHLFRGLIANAAGIVTDGATGEEVEQQLPPLAGHQVNLHLSPFGASGPYKEWRSSDMVDAALGGWMYLMGSPDRPPLQPGGPYPQYVAGLYAAFGALVALYHARFTGQGQRIEISVQEASVSVLPGSIAAYGYYGAVAQRPVHPEVYPCQDGYMGLYGGGGQPGWEALCSVIGRPELAHDPRFSTPQARLEHESALSSIYREALKDRCKEDLFHAGQRSRLPVAPVYTLDELESCQQLVEREYFEQIDHPLAGRLRYPGAPFKLGATPMAPRSPAPLLGQHNLEVYGALDLAPSQVAALRNLGAL